MKKTFIIGLCVAALTACEKEVTKNVDQDKIFTHFELYYNENSNTTTATATFRFNSLTGTRLKLTDPSTVSVNGNQMAWTDESGAYQHSFPGLVPSAEFVWVDLDGNSFSNTAEIRDIEFPDPLPSYHHDDSVNYFMWQGAPLDSFEMARLTLDGEGASDARIFSVDTVGATTITIDSVKLSQVDSGVVNMILERIYSPELIERTSAGGLRVGTYRPTDRSFLLD